MTRPYRRGLTGVVLRVRLLQVRIELLLQRLRVFLLVWAMTPRDCLECHAGTCGAFGFYRYGPEPLYAAEGRLFCWHGSLRGYTASALDLRQERLALLPRNASFIITIAERE